MALSPLVLKVVADLADFNAKMDSVGSKLQNAGAGMASAGAGLTAGVTAPLIGAAAASVKFATDFNSGMANVASLGPEAAAAIAEWTPMVQDIAKSTGKGTGDMTDGLYNVVSAFGASDDAMAILEANARAGAAGLATTADAINLTSAVTKGYGDTSAQAVQKAADLALQTVALGQTTFPELASSIGAVTPLTSALGVSQEELFGTMATLTGVTGSASEVSTQLRGVLQGMMTPTADMSALMAQLGYENGQAMLAGEGLQGAIGAIIGAAETSGTPLSKYLGSIEGQTAAMALAGPQSDVFSEKLAAMGTAAGAVDTAFRAQTEGVNSAGFQWQQLKTEMQIVATNVGQQLIPAFSAAMTALMPAIEIVGNLAQRFAEADPWVRNVVLAIGGIAVAIGPVLIVVGTLISSVGAIMGAAAAAQPVIAAIGVVIGGLSAPILIAIGAVAALALAWKTDFGGIQTKTRAAWENHIKPVFAALGLWVTDTLMPIIQNLYTKWTTEWWPTIQTVTENVGTIINEVIAEIQRWIEDNLQPIVKAFYDKWVDEWWPAIQSAVETMWEKVEPLFTAIKTWLDQTLPPVLQAIKGKFATVFQGIRDAIQPVKDLMDRFIAAVQGFWDWISGREFKFNISLPDLPDWATPGSPIPLHTAWKNFFEDMQGRSFEPRMNTGGMFEPGGLMLASAGMGGQQVINETYYLTAPDERTMHLFAHMTRRDQQTRVDRMINR